MTELVAKIEDDVRFEEGKKLMKRGEYEDAIGLFSSLLASRVEEFGELSLQAAPAYYEYGNALLVQQEENPSDTLLGNADSNGDDGTQAKTVEDTVVSEDDDDEDQGEDEKDDDLQIAWENLDVARLILEKEPDGQEKLLSSVYIRLGDLMRLEERPDDAVTEYSKALTLREKVCQPDDRDLCDVFFCLAVAYVDLSSKVDGEEVKHKKEEALKYYLRAREVLELHLSSVSSSSKQDIDTVNVSDIQDLIDILSETVDALGAELKQLGKSNNCMSSSNQPVTTIGFGVATTGSSINNCTLVSKKRSSDEANSDVQVLQMKKKTKEG